MVGETLKERTTCLEQLLAEWPSEDGTVASWADHMWNDVGVQHHLIEQNDEFVGEKMRNMKADV